MEAEQTDGQCYEEGSTGMDAENAGIGERIAGRRLDQRTGDAESCAAQ